jgi:hypothetical protein
MNIRSIVSTTHEKLHIGRGYLYVFSNTRMSKYCPVACKKDACITLCTALYHIACMYVFSMYHMHVCMCECSCIVASFHLAYTQVCVKQLQGMFTKYVGKHVSHVCNHVKHAYMHVSMYTCKHAIVVSMKACEHFRSCMAFVS